MIAHGRRIEARKQSVHRHAEAVADVPLVDGGDAAALLLLDARAEAGAAEAEQVALGRGDIAVAVGIEFARGIRVDEELVHRVRADLGVLVDGRDHEAHVVVRKRVAEDAADLVAIVLGQVVVLALHGQREPLADAVQGARRAQVDGAADAALEVRRLGGLQHVGPGDHFGGQHIERELAAVAVRREQPSVEGDDAELRPKPAHVHVLALAAARAPHGNTGNVREGVGDVVVRKAAEVLGNDGILDDLCALLAIERLDERSARAGDDDLGQLGGFRCAGRGLSPCGEGGKPAERKGDDCYRRTEPNRFTTHGDSPLNAGQGHPR